MAYRLSELKELCIHCGEPAQHRCPRCDSPHCNPHQPTTDHRCFHCQALLETLDQELQDRPLSPTMLAACYALSATSAGLLSVALTPPLLEIGVMATLAIILPTIAAIGLAPLWLSALRRRRLQRAFLAERPHQRTLRNPKQRKPHEPSPPPLERVLGNLSLAFLSLSFLPVLGQLWGTGYAWASLQLSRQRKRRPPMRSKVALALHLLTFGGWIALIADLVASAH